MKILVVSQDSLDGALGGTSIRALELAKVLTAVGEVTLAGTGTPPATLAGIACVGYEPQHPSALRAPIDAADLIVAMPQWPPLMRLLRRARARVVFDLYVPEALETIGGFPGQRPLLRHLFTEYAIDRCTEALRIGDHFICASEGQRDLYLGVMLAERLIPASRYEADPSLRSLIDVVPFGVAAEPATRSGSGIRGQIDSIGASDEVVLWNGGVWPWLDPQTAIRAVAQLAAGRTTRLHLVFMGASDALPARRATEDAHTLAAKLGVLGSHVHFHAGWVPYSERADWLLDADAALYAHHDQLETRFAFRTRLLDCFWARLPIVCTSGDELADRVQREGAGAVFAPGDVDGAAAALADVLNGGRERYADALAALADEYRWERAAAPLVAFATASPASSGAAALARSPRRFTRPGVAARRTAYAVLRRGLDLVGLRDRPRL